MNKRLVEKNIIFDITTEYIKEERENGVTTLKQDRLIEGIISRAIELALLPPSSDTIKTLYTNLVDEKSDLYINNVDYARDLITYDGSIPEELGLKSFYYMGLLENNADDNNIIIGLVLTKGFLSCMEISPSEKAAGFLQEILRILFDNGCTNRELIRYYMVLALSGSNSLKNNLKVFLTGDK